MTWEQFFEWLMGHESRAITNDPRDPGGQTCWGISRRYHPTWPGWRMVDAGTTSGPELGLAVSTPDTRPGWVSPGQLKSHTGRCGLIA